MEVMDRLDQLLSGLGERETAELDKLLAEELKKPWLPSPGPQLEAYLSKADLLLYGGAAGGGKTDLICGLALNEHRRSVIYRRQANDLDGFWERLTQLCPNPRHRDGNKRKMTTQDRRLVECGHLDAPGSELSWQGRPHDLICVGRGTLVLMGDGAYRPIEDIRVGELVETLEGPQRVTRTFPVQWKEAVEVTAHNEHGWIIAAQIQSLRHEVLTTAGWVCPGKSSSVPPYGISSGVSFSPKQFPSSHIGALWCGWTSGRLFCSPLGIFLGLRRIVERWPFPLRSARACAPGTYVASAALDQESCFAGFDDSRQGASRHQELSDLQGRRRPVPVMAGEGHNTPRSASSCDRRDVSRRSSLRDCLASCWSGIRLCGGRIHRFLGLYVGQGTGQLYLLQRVCAAGRNPKHLTSDDGAKVPVHTHCIASYVRPYTRETRRIDARVVLSSYRVRSVGKKELFDLEVEHANHYITEDGFVNKNCFDEGSQLTAYKVKFVLGWLRSTEVARCRAVIATNPPIGADGTWLIEWFAPWLDPLYPNPAKPGELRFAIAIGNANEIKTIWVDGPDPVEIDGETYVPLSRTFIPSRLDDNPYLKDTNYRAQINSMPEPLRSQLLHGDFLAGREDDEWQVIPSAWIRAAQERWKDPEATRMLALGVDVAQGGTDSTVIAPLHIGNVFAKPESRPGRDTPDGPSVANLILKMRRDAAAIAIDTTGGWGGSARDHLRTHHQIKIIPIVFSTTKECDGLDAQTQLGYANLRAKMYWQFRLALDPASSERVALPPGDRILAQFAAARWQPRTGKIVIESKEDIRDRLGSSPDEADAIVMAWHVRNNAYKAERVQAARAAQEVERFPQRLGWMG